MHTSFSSSPVIIIQVRRLTLAEVEKVIKKKMASLKRIGETSSSAYQELEELRLDILHLKEQK